MQRRPTKVTDLSSVFDLVLQNLEKNGRLYTIAFHSVQGCRTIRLWLTEVISRRSGSANGHKYRFCRGAGTAASGATACSLWQAAPGIDEAIHLAVVVVATLSWL